MERLRTRLIYNPSSGREEARRFLPDILKKLEKGGFETSCHATEGPGDATSAARYAVEQQFDVVIAAGGDGTVYEVINGLAESPHRPMFGVIPLGTSNDLARALAIPRQVSKACDVIVGRRLKKIDIGRAGDRFFVNIAAGGILTELTYAVPSKMKTMLGQLAYYAKGLEKLAFLRPIPLRLETDNDRFEGEMMLFLVANSNSVGGFEKLAPQADMADGFFDVLLVEKVSLPDFVRLGTMALRGEHVNEPKVKFYRSKKLFISADEAVPLNLDGELGGSLPCHIENLHQHIAVFVP
jgi:diacylglycerol kinase (ATP)